jgi:hypothetical protein
LIFLRDGTVADNAACGDPSTDVLTFAPNPGIVFAVDSSAVRYNRYYITVSEAGLVSIRPTKE